MNTRIKAYSDRLMSRCNELAQEQGKLWVGVEECRHDRY